MKTNLMLSVALGGFALALFSQPVLAEAPASLPGDLVEVCEVPPDFFEGNCPPTVVERFDTLKSEGVTGEPFNAALVNATVALGERLQRAEAENDIPLCIDIAEGIMQLSTFSTDAGQREAVARLAESSCCVTFSGANFGQFLGASRVLPITGLKTDGEVRNGAVDFRSASASFIADDVRAGDILVIKSGRQQGFYVIAGATGPDTLVLQQDALVSFAGWDVSEEPVVFEIRRGEDPLEDNICEPGGSTASIAALSTEAAPASDE